VIIFAFDGKFDYEKSLERFEKYAKSKKKNLLKEGVKVEKILLRFEKRTQLKAT
jgi:hypothetical protein